MGLGGGWSRIVFHIEKRGQSETVGDWCLGDIT